MLPWDAIFNVSSLNFVIYVVNSVANISYVCCPTPHGVGGLKYGHDGRRQLLGLVPPLTGWVD